ncbi:MAG: hypothetical protein KME21_27575 [Desmonostoc vinosum HA7617-LM4]|jgi:hypothetical protein|nr:hypothetical protein [Desmonostoc vinosum HA7617-LM4]
MEGRQKIEISDLLDQAVENALARRNSALHSEDDLLSLSDAETTNIAGGLTTVSKIVKPPIVLGIKPICPPIIVGLIAPLPLETL